MNDKHAKLYMVRKTKGCVVRIQKCHRATNTCESEQLTEGTVDVSEVIKWLRRVVASRQVVVCSDVSGAENKNKARGTNSSDSYTLNNKRPASTSRFQLGSVWVSGVTKPVFNPLTVRAGTLRHYGLLGGAPPFRPLQYDGHSSTRYSTEILENKVRTARAWSSEHHLGNHSSPMFGKPWTYLGQVSVAGCEAVLVSVTDSVVCLTLPTFRIRLKHQRHSSQTTSTHRIEDRWLCNRPSARVAMQCKHVRVCCPHWPCMHSASSLPRRPHQEPTLTGNDCKRCLVHSLP